MSGTTLAPAIGTPLPSRCVPPGTSAQVSPSLPLVPRLLRRVARGLGNLLLVVVVLAFTGLAVGPHVFGYRTMTMLTGSMAPGINPGDVTVAVQEPTSALAVGQIISYQIPVDDHRVVSHRVVKVTRSPSGAVVVQTKGDHNPAPTPGPRSSPTPRSGPSAPSSRTSATSSARCAGRACASPSCTSDRRCSPCCCSAEIWRSPRARRGRGVRGERDAPCSTPPCSASSPTTSATPRGCARSSTCGPAC